MDKYDKLLDAVEHPENYPPEELERIASDPDTAELYRTLCSARSSEFSGSTLSREDVDKEWERFSRGRVRKGFGGWLAQRKIAAAVAIAVATCSVLAVGISIGVGMSRKNISERNEVENVTAVGGVAAETPEIYTDTVSIVEDNLVFEDEPLDVILNRLAPHYGVKVNYKSDAAKSVRLFFKWDSSLSINDVIDQLNTFDRIRLYLDGDTLTVN